jgi:hypothetical protein
MSCGCNSGLFGGKCCGGPGQIALQTPAVLPANVDLSALNIYNAIFYGLTATPNGATNLAALNAAVAAAQQVQGGIVLIPNMGGRAGSPSLAGTVVLNPSGQFNNVSLQGTSNAQMLIQTVNGDTFYLNNGSGAGGVNEGGQVFSLLHVKYTPGITNGAAFHLANAPQTTLNQIVMDDPPVGVFCDNTLLCVVNEGTVVYNNNPVGIGFLISGPAMTTSATQQTRLSRCKVLWSTNHIGTVGSYGMQLVQSNHATITDFTTAGGWVALGVTPSTTPQNNVQQTSVSAAELGAQQYGILIQPQSATGSRVQDFRVFGGQTQGGSNATPTSVGVFADPNGGAVNWITDVKFIGHTVESWKLYGYQFNGGQNYEVIGGTVSSNGTAAIAATGVGPINLICTGVDLSASYQGGTPQSRAVVWSASGGTATFTNCPMLGYTNPPVSVTGTPAKLGFFNCAGYNDQNTPLCNSGGGSAPVPLAVSAATASSLAGGVNYWGPSLVTFTAASAASNIRVNGTPMNYAPNQFVALYLASPYDTIQFGVSPATFAWTGK